MCAFNNWQLLFSQHWSHVATKDTRRLPDNVLKAVISTGYVSFVFHQKSHEATVASVEKRRTESDENNDEDGENDE